MNKCYFFLLFLLYFQHTSCFQKICKVQIFSPPFTDCNATHWTDAVLNFGNKNDEVTLPMSEVCSKEGPVSFDVELNSTVALAKGEISLLQRYKDLSFEGNKKEWFIENIKVICNDSVQAKFGLGRPIVAGVPYTFFNFDTTVESSFDNQYQRLKERAINQARYHQIQPDYNTPLFMRELTKEDMYERKLREKVLIPVLIMFKKLRQRYGAELFTDVEFECFEDVKRFLNHEDLPDRSDTMNNWDKDSWFVAQRLQGLDPAVIENVNELPIELSIEEVKYIMNENIENVIADGRLFVNDLKAMIGIEGVTAPKAWFYVDKKNELKPLAIKLSRDGNANPVFYPTDEKYAWILAKMYYNGLEAFHQIYKTHFGEYHFLMDQVAAITFNFLSPQHPVFKILKQHFYTMISANIQGYRFILVEGGVADNSISGNRKSAFDVINRVLSNTSFRTLHPILNNADRKTGKIKIYPYRDRQIPIFETIQRYVKKVLRNYYPMRKNINSDVELKDWRKMLSLSNVYGGVALKDLPGNDVTGSMTLNDLTDIVATFIWISSAGHTAVNNPLYQQYSFVLNYPTKLRRPPPTSKTGITEQEILKYIGNKFHAFNALTYGLALSTDGGGKYIGDFDRQFLFSPKDQSAINKFQKQLESLRKKKYGSLKYQYHFLDIDQIRNSMRA